MDWLLLPLSETKPSSSNPSRILLKMPEEDDLSCQEELSGPVDPIFSMVVIRKSDDRVVFPPIYHENLQVASSICGFDKYLESPSESESPSSSSRRSASSSSFSLFPSDSDGQPPIACELDRKFPSETEEKYPLSPGGESPPLDAIGQPSLTACQFYKFPRSPSYQGAKFPPSDSVIIPPRKFMYREADVFQDWWKLLLVRVHSKLKTLLTWFSTTLRPFYPFLAVAVWWWMRVRARRRHIKGETMDCLRDAIKERDERIVQLLQQIAQMNSLLINHHKEIVSRR